MFSRTDGSKIAVANTRHSSGKTKKINTCEDSHQGKGIRQEQAYLHYIKYKKFLEELIDFLMRNDRNIHILTQGFMRGIYEICRSDGLKCYDILVHTRVHNRFVLALKT